MKSKDNSRLVKHVLAFLGVIVALIVTFIWSVNTGSIKVTPVQLFKGLFVQYDDSVSAIYFLRFPRIIISMFVGAALAVSGVLFQAVLKNPLTDPSIIGISGGASFTSVLITAFFPQFIALVPFGAFIGGVASFLIVYSLSWKEGLSPLRIILVGIAVSTMFTGITSAINSMGGGNLSQVTAIVNGNITMKTWEDVHTIFYYLIISLLISMCFAKPCNLLALDDKTARGIGINTNRIRIMVSLVAVMLASISTAVAGVVSFIGLIVPHIARIIVGGNHKQLIPFSLLLGAFIFLLADTLGRTIVKPYEMNASIIMAIIGGPYFILLLRRRVAYGS